MLNVSDVNLLPCVSDYPLPQKKEQLARMGQVGAKMCQVPWMFSAPFHDRAVDSLRGDLMCQGLGGH